MILTLDPIRHFVKDKPNVSALLGGIFAALSQPPTFWIWGLLGFSLLLFLIHQSNNLKEALRYNFFFSMGFYGYGFYWTVIAISIFIEQFWWAIPIAFIGLPLIFTIFTSAITIFAWNCRHKEHYVMIYSLLWVLVEYITHHIFTGLPWMQVGYAAGFSDILSQFTSIAGILGLSFVLFNLFSSFYYLFDKNKRLQRADIIYFAIISSLVIFYGIWRLNYYPPAFKDMRLRVIQPSIQQGEKWSEELFWQHLLKHRELSLENTRQKPDIIIWSEAAVTAPHQIKQVRHFLNKIAKDSGAILITGAVSKKNNKYYTSLIAISPEEKLLFEYNKKHLVPFGEYVPLQNILPIKKLTYGLENFAFGEGPNITSINSLKIRPLICYESIFPEEVRGEDADLFINITNSSWYGDSSAPYHLFYVNKFRAIENSIPVIISANSGISGAFDSLGRLIAKTGFNDITLLDLTLPQKIQAFSPYSLLGFSVILCIVIFLHYIKILVNKSD